MTKSSCTFIGLHRRTGEFADPEWFGTPDAETGVFTIGNRYVIRFLELRIGIWPESVVGPNKPILSVRYEASLATGESWAGNDPVSGKWRFDGRDDLGTEYEVQQGASGFRDPGRTLFDSDISFEPDVPVGARWIEIRFTDWREPDQSVQTFRADVPPLQGASVRRTP